MKTLQTLIRLHKQQVDERRRYLAELRDHEQRLIEQRRRFEEDAEKERLLAGTSLELARTYPAFAKQVKVRRAELERARLDVQARIAQAEDAVAEAFQELKRFELAEEERQRQEAAEFRRREAMMLDEVASQRFSRAHAAEEGGLPEE